MKTWLLVAAVLLSACSQDEPPPPEKKEPQGRVETRSIRNTDAVGYSGSQIADKVDRALDKNDAAAKKAQEEADQAE